MKSASPSNLSATWMLVICSTFFWGSNFNAGHSLAGAVTPLTAAAERFFMALLVFLLLRFWHGKSESTLQARDLMIMAPLGIAGVFGFNFAFFSALQTTSALNAALIMALSPMVSLLLSAWWLAAKVSQRQIIGILIAFAGVSLVITGGHFERLHVAAGDLWMLGACLLWSLYSVGSKRFAPHIPPLQLARWTVSIGAVALIIAAVLLENPQQLLPQLSGKAHLTLFYMALGGTVMAYIFWLKGVHHLGPDRSAIAFNLVPVFTLLVSLLLGTLPSAMQLLGMVITLSGMLFSSGWRPRFFQKSSMKEPIKPIPCRDQG